MDRLLSDLDCSAPIATRRAAVCAASRLTWGDVYVLTRGLLPTDLRLLIAARLDVHSGPVYGTLGTEGLGLDMAEILRRLLTEPPAAVAVFAALWDRASADDRRTLVRAAAVVNGQQWVGFGEVWQHAQWDTIPPLYPPGTILTSAEAMVLHWLMERGLHVGDATSATGDLWVAVVRTLCESPTRQVQGPTQLHWMLADPPRCSAQALRQLLETPNSALRAWALTTLVPRHGEGLGPLRAGRVGPPLR